MRAELSRRAVLCGAVALGLSACGMAGNLRQGVDFTVVNDRLLMSGLITARTPAAFAEVLAANPQITTVVLQDMEGSIHDEALVEMGYALRARGLATALQSDSVIHSGAVDLFLAGTRRTMVRGAEIGVHSWADGFGQGRDYPRDAPEHRMMRAYTAAMLGSEDFYWFTLDAAPAEALYIMDEGDIARYGLLTAPVIVFN